MEETKQIFIYVSPNGNDKWSGKISEANNEKNDGPLATLEAAQKKVRKLIAQPESRKSIKVILRGGRYELKKTLVFGPEDSGAQPLKGEWEKTVAPAEPVVYQAFPGESAIISGGRKISGWKTEQVNGRKAWVADIPETKKGKWNFHHLWVNGQRRFRPQLPEEGHFRIVKAIGPSNLPPKNAAYLKGGQSFIYADDDLKNWHNLSDIELHVITLWKDLRVRIKTIDEKKKIVGLDRMANHLVDDFGTGGALYNAENIFEEFKKTGQWYLDRKKGKLYYLPMQGEKLDNTEIVVPFLKEILKVEGSTDTPVEYLNFEGLTFSNAEWDFPEDCDGSKQAAWEVAGAIIMKHAKNCAVKNCTISNVGQYGVEFCEETSDSSVENCDIHDLGAGGVKIWHGCKRITVSDNNIYDGGHYFMEGVGVLAGKVCGCKIVHNSVHDFFYTGMSIGWRWGYAESDTFGNIIEWNHIYNIGKFALSDMGGIYTLGMQPGTRIRYNLIHDINSRTYGGWAIYLDEGSSDILVENNICYRTKSTVFNQHYGRDNIVRNNIFAFGGEGQVSRTRVENHISFTLENNIIFYDKGTLFHTSNENLIMRNNLYWHKKGSSWVNFSSEPQSFGTKEFPEGFKSAAYDADTISLSENVSRKSKNSQHGVVPACDYPSETYPNKNDWKKALKLPTIFVNTSKQTVNNVCNNIQLLKDKKFLYISVTCGILSYKSKKDYPAETRAWTKDHVEVFLAPDAAKQEGIQLCVCRDGTKDGQTLSSEAIEFKWDCKVQEGKGQDDWTAIFKIPLDAVEKDENNQLFRIFIGRGHVPEIPLKDWNRTDKGSIVEDPLFVNPNRFDFRLKEDSPAFKIGFRPFSLTGIGPRKKQ